MVTDLRKAAEQALEALETVTKQMLKVRDELAERGARPVTNKAHQALWDSSFASYTDAALPAATALREALAKPAVPEEPHIWGYAVFNPKEPFVRGRVRLVETLDHVDRVSAELYESETVPLADARKLYTPTVQQSEQASRGWAEAAKAWEICSSIHKKWAKGKDAFYTTRQTDFSKHANEARAMAAAPQPKDTP